MENNQSPSPYRYEGTAAIFDGELGEFIVMAPCLKTLNAVIRKYNLAISVSPDMCRVISLDKIPSKELTPELPGISQEVAG